MRFVMVLILGIALGATVALLVAPQRGAETIRVLRERAQRWRGEADEDDPADA